MPSGGSSRRCKLLHAARKGPRRLRLELEIEFEPTTAAEYGLKLRLSPDEKEQTRIYYSCADGCLYLDPTTASENPDMVARNVQCGPLHLAADESLRLRIFLDHSIVEVYANQRQCLTKRIYPSRSSQGIALFAQGDDVAVRSLHAWGMATIWPQVYNE